MSEKIDDLQKQLDEVHQQFGAEKIDLDDGEIVGGTFRDAE